MRPMSKHNALVFERILDNLSTFAAASFFVWFESRYFFIVAMVFSCLPWESMNAEKSYNSQRIE